MKKIQLFPIFLLLVLTGCKNTNNKSDEVNINDILNEESTEPELVISEESINEIIQSIPSPLEMASLIKESGASFNEDFLNSTDNQDLYRTDFEKAMAMGIYAGDLGYINIYEKSYVALKYLKTIKKLADDLNVGQFFDFETIKRMASNADKIDSLLYLSTLNFERMDHYLRSQKRSNLSVLLVTATWIESLYIVTKVGNLTSSEPIIERIAEQKIILNQILLMVSTYSDNQFFQNLHEEISLLKKEFESVSIDYVYREPEIVEEDGRLVIIDNSTTEVNITQEQINAISNVLSEIRLKIIESD
ncbi:MAG: lipoprotein [Bacteroidales bacterium]|nr:lipoprotein [Bacteroidales bacterium]